MEEASGRAGMGGARRPQAACLSQIRSQLFVCQALVGARGGRGGPGEPRGAGACSGAQLGWSVYLPGCDMGP